MGGAIGTRAAANGLRGRVRRLVPNDNGPEPALASIERIRGQAGKPAAFEPVSWLEPYFRTAYPHQRCAHRRAVAPAHREFDVSSARRRVMPHADPAMVMQCTHHADDYRLWNDWDRLDIPVLSLRGEHSDLPLRDTTERMRRPGPLAVVVLIAGCGHAPAIKTPEPRRLIERFHEATD